MLCIRILQIQCHTVDTTVGFLQKSSWRTSHSSPVGVKARLHWSASASAPASVFFKYLAFHFVCLHWAASASFIRVRIRFFSTVHRLYMASALTRYFVKDADAEADADADQCKRTFRVRYGVFFCEFYLDVYSVPLSAVICIISRHFGPHCNGTRLYKYAKSLSP